MSYRDSPAFLFELRFRLTAGRVTIRAYDGNYTSPDTGHQRIDCEVIWNGNPVFRARDTWCAVNRWTAIDSDDAKELVASLVAMQPGDTVSDYFASYTPEQLAFAEACGEELSFYAAERYGES